MISVLKSIFGGSDIISKGFKLVDDIHYSKEEKEEDQRKMVELKSKTKINMLEAYAPFKLAQRYLALIFSITFIGSFIAVLVMYLLGHPIEGVIEIMDLFKIAWIELTIITFYFGAGVIESVKRKEIK